MAVAKSYQSYHKNSEPYKKNGKMYILIEHPKTGKVREARWYTDEEYARLYPEDEVAVTRTRSVKDVLGFHNGYITIFKGDTYSLLDWFRESSARYHKYWGWYFVSEEPFPNYPVGIEPVKLMWEDVAQPGKDALKDEAAIRELVDQLVYDTSPSKFQGNVGDRIERTLTVVKVIPQEGYYGASNMYIFEDADKNIYVWNTAARTFAQGATVNLRGTIKSHQTYKAVKQTILTRCTEISNK